MYAVKTKALIIWAVTTQLICAFVFAYAKYRFSHDAVQITLEAHLVDRLLNLCYESRVMLNSL